MTDYTTSCQYCQKPFSEEEIRKKKKFCTPKHKAAFHREKPFKSALQVTVVSTNTDKGGVITTIRTDIRNREQHAKVAIPGTRMYLIPVSDDLIEG